MRLPPTPEQIRTITASRLFEDGRVVFAGVGAPLVASGLARRLQAPNLTIVIEGGILGTPLLDGRLPISTNEMYGAQGATMLTDVTDIFLFAQSGYFDYGALGAAQVDRFGNVNTSIIGDWDNPTVRLPGSGGANDIASLCNKVLVITSHERRRFVERVDFITSPGWIGPGAARQQAGLRFGGPSVVVTELGMFDFDPDRRHLRLFALQHGVTVEQVQRDTGFDLAVADEIIEIAPPDDHEIATLAALTGSGRGSEPVVGFLRNGTSAS